MCGFVTEASYYICLYKAKNFRDLKSFKNSADYINSDVSSNTWSNNNDQQDGLG